MDKLEMLPNVARLSKRVLRVLGQNPGKFTLQGTNTYLVGSAPPFILLDTGEGKPEYIPHLSAALAEASAYLGGQHKQLVSDIVISHRHADHHGGLPSVLKLLGELQHSPAVPRIHKYPLEDTSVSQTLAQIPSSDFTGLLDLSHNQTLQGTDATLTVIHTPGHTTDSICLRLSEEDALFTFDTVLGQGTAVFEDLKVYMESLRRIADLDFTTVYPGHGPVVEDGPKHVKGYITHREAREKEILALLSEEQEHNEKSMTVEEIVATIYKAYPQSLWPAAGRGVQQHLDKLLAEGVVSTSDSARWALV